MIRFYVKMVQSDWKFDISLLRISADISVAASIISITDNGGIDYQRQVYLTV